MNYVNRVKFKKQANIITSVNNVEVINGFGCLIVIEPSERPKLDIEFVSRIKKDVDEPKEKKHEEYYEFINQTK